MLCRAYKPNRGDHQTHCGHRRERSEAQADYRRHAGLWRRRQQQWVVSWKTCSSDIRLIQPARFSSHCLEQLLTCARVCVCMSQLEADHRLHRPAVWAILQGRERPEQKEHPGQPSPLLPLLHPSVWARVITHTCTHTHTLTGMRWSRFSVITWTCLHLCVSCHRLRPVDVEFMKALHEKVNIIPLIAKADCLTPNEIKKLKDRVRPVTSHPPWMGPLWWCAHIWLWWLFRSVVLCVNV